MGFLRRFYVRWWRLSYPLTLLVLAGLIWFYTGINTLVSTSKGGEQQTVDGPGWFIFFLIMSLVGIGIYRWSKDELPPLWITVTAVVTPLFLWGFWLINPEWYMEWRHSGYFLWMIATTAALGWLANNKAHSIARTARVGLLLLMVIAIGIGATRQLDLRSYLPEGMPGSTKVSIPSGLPWQTAFLYFSGCESGNGTPGSGRQFNPDGSVVTNKNKDGTIDRGILQINSRHDAEAKRLGLDLNKEEDNKKFGEILYNRNYLRDWRSSQHCWGPQLAAFEQASTTTRNSRYTVQVILVTREWNRVFVPKDQNLVFQRMELVAFEVKIPQNPEPYQFPRVLPRDHTRVPDTKIIDFRVTDEEKESMKMELRFTPY